MWRNYLKIAIRNSIKDKYYILINVFGLGIAMAFGLTIYLLHAYNLEFDTYYKNTDSIVRLHCLKPDSQGNEERYEMSPIPMAQMATDEIAGLEEFVRFVDWNDNLKYRDIIFNESIAYADTNFFELFPIKLISGSNESLKEKNSIFLTQKAAAKYFAEQDPLGEIMTIHYGKDRSVDFTVAGVFDKIPLNSSFDFEAMVPIDNFFYGREIEPDDWSPWQQVTTFFRMSSPDAFTQVNQSIKKYIPIQNDAREEWKVSDYQLVHFKDEDLLSQGVLMGSHANLRLRPQVLVVFTVLALLILLIVSFNLANTAMALMARRFKEIGVRKAMGGGSSHIFTQFMFEMSWTSFLGFLVGAALFHWISQGFFALWSIPHEALEISFFRLVLAFVAFFALAAILSGLSPALYSRKLQPTSIFQKQIRLKQTNWASRILISIQFAISLTLIIAGIIFTRNTEFLKMLDMGFDKEGLIITRVDSESEYIGLKNQIASFASISRYAGTDHHIGWSYEDSYVVLDTGKVEVRTLNVGRDYLSVMGVDMITGRNFDFDQSSDLNENIIVNQAYVEKFDITDPIGKTINLADEKKYIIGVTGNIIDHVYQDYEPIPKIILAASEEDCRRLIVKADAGKEEEVFAYLEDSWKKLIPDRPFTGRYQDDMTMGMVYKENNNLKTIFLYLAVLGSLLSITGIFALSSLNVSRRIKEIGIRKVLGASTNKIILLLNRDFAITMILAIVIGSALGIFLTSELLNFIYKFHIGVGVFSVLISIVFIVATAFLTTSATIFSAANMNPSETLRDE